MEISLRLPWDMERVSDETALVDRDKGRTGRDMLHIAPVPAPSAQASLLRDTSPDQATKRTQASP